jgi:hypothetical protein
MNQHASRLATIALAILLAAQTPDAGARAQSSGRTLIVAAGGDLQAALDQARPGDTIRLEPGAVYRGPFVLPFKDGDDWIVVQSGASDLPAAGTRVTPAHRARLAVLEAASGTVVETAPGAHRYRLVGLEIRPAAGASVLTTVTLGDGRERLEAALPHDIRIERCYIHGEPELGTRRGVALNGRALAVVDSTIADFKDPAADSQAIAGWNGPGPFAIENNFLEGAGENLMFGGADPSIANLVPADIRIVGNHFSKPVAWRDPPAPGRPRWAVKNILELKNARRVHIEGNVLEHNWAGAQNGFAVLFTVRNQDGAAPWSVVEDVTFVNNVLRATASAINILGRDDNYPSEVLSRVSIVNNVFTDIGTPPWGESESAGRFLQLLAESRDVVVEHNTVLQTGNVLTLAGGSHAGFVFRNNIVRHNEFGLIGEGRGIGLDSISRYLPGGVVSGNVFVGGAADRYPPGNHFVGGLEQVGFANPAAGLLGLGPGSPFRGKGTDGRDVGADVERVTAATSGVAGGTGDAPPPCDRSPRLKMPPCPEAGR